MPDDLGKPCPPHAWVYKGKVWKSGQYHKKYYCARCQEEREVPQGRPDAETDA